MRNKCPKCGCNYREQPAISRLDNKTEICPQCGVSEAMAVMILNGRKTGENIEKSNTKLKCTNQKCRHIFDSSQAERCVEKFGGIYWGCPKCCSIANKIER